MQRDPAGSEGHGDVVVDWADVRARGVVYEDDACLVIDKPSDLTLVGDRDHLDLMTAAREAGEWLMPAHRIDRVTSGLVLLAKSLEAHAMLTQQFRDRSVSKRYLAIVVGGGLPERATIDLPLREGRKARTRVAAARVDVSFDEWALRWSAKPDMPDARRATTTFERVAECERASLVMARPVTGRRHQLRVHFAWIGHAVVGDPLFESNPSGRRTRLHSTELAFDSAPGNRIECRSEPGADFFAGFPELG